MSYTETVSTGSRVDEVCFVVPVKGTKAIECCIASKPAPHNGRMYTITVNGRLCTGIFGDILGARYGAVAEARKAYYEGRVR
jgi:hypothetical protein